MPSQIIFISQIAPATELCKIKVRIARLWGFPKKDKPGEFTAIDVLLVDEKVIFFAVYNMILFLTFYEQ